MIQLIRQRPLLVLFIVASNILLTLWCLLLDPVINFDGIRHISVADLFLLGSFDDGLGHSRWPFYSAFIAVIAKLTTLSTETSAHAFNVAMVVSLCLAFVSIVSFLSNQNKRTVLIAALVILFLPSISKYRSVVTGDFGYLSCYLWSLYFLLRYSATPNRNLLVGAMVFAVLSSLFHIEGIIFVLIAFYLLFSASSNKELRTFIKGLSIVLVLSCLGLVYWYVRGKYLASMAFANEAGVEINGFSEFVVAQLQQRLGEDPVNITNVVKLAFTSLGAVLEEILRAMAVVYFLFAVFAYVKKFGLEEQKQRRIWWTYLTTGLILLIGVSLIEPTLTSRYALAVMVTILLLAPFALDRLIVMSKENKVGLIIGVHLLALVSLFGLDVSTNERYIKNAGQWVAMYTEPEKTVYSNNNKAIYYTSRGAEENLREGYSWEVLKEFVSSQRVRHFDYLIYVGNHNVKKEDVMRQTLTFHFKEPLYIGKGEDGNFAFVFKVKRKRAY